MAVTDGLIAYWPLGEASGNAIDSISGYDLTAINSPGAATGKVGAARDFSRTSTTYFTRSSNSDLQFGAKDWSVQAWFYTSSISGTNQGVFSKWIPAAREIIFWLQSGQIRIELGNGAGSTLGWVFGDTLTNGNWYHAVLSYNLATTTLALYLNNAKTTWSRSGLGVGSHNFEVGTWQGASGGIFDGLIDEVAKWNRTLSDAEVAELYNSGSGMSLDFVGTPVPLIVPGLVGAGPLFGGGLVY